MAKRQSKESLASKIAGVLSAIPIQFHPDDEHTDDTSAKVTHLEANSDDGDDTEEILSKFRKQNIDLLGDVDKRYAGKKGSRKSLQEESSDEASDNDEWSTEDEDNTMEETGRKQSESEQENVDSEGSEPEYSNDDQENEESDEGEIYSDDENFQNMKQTNESLQVKKGISVRNQMNMWENLMEIRIQLQKCVSAANRLPQKDYYQEMVKQIDADFDFKSKVKETKGSIESVLDKLLLFQNLAIKMYPETKKLDEQGKNAEKSDVGEDDDEEIPSDTDDEIVQDNHSECGKEEQEPQRKKRKMNEYERDISGFHEKYRKYRNDTIEKWNAKTRLSVTKNAGQVHSVLSQIDHILGDKRKLLRRTQLKRSEFKILGQSEREVVESNEDNGDVKQVDEYNNEIFDDSDFYHQLLRELIEVKSADITDPVQLGRQWIQLQNLRNKMKRKIDTRATKGRKIRYTVHTKLVNFMAPLTQQTWTDDAKNELYSSLFGKFKSKTV